MVSIFPILILSVIASLLGVRAMHLDRAELDLSPSSMVCLRPDGALAVTRRWVAVLVTTVVAVVIGPAVAASAAPLPFSYDAFGFIYNTPALLSSPNAVANGVAWSSTGASYIPWAGSVSGGGVAEATNTAPTFIGSADGVVVSTSRSRLVPGFESAGLQKTPTSSPGMQYTLPDGTLVRVMEPSGQAPLRASFTNANGGPISPFTGKPVQPPTGLTKAERLDFIRARTHVELGP